jgi:1,2-phenylacetyl-CoA epoxidase catalytic subunit
MDKMLEEERYHAHHGRGWFRTIRARGGDSLRALETAAREAQASVAEWLGPEHEREDQSLVAAGVKTRTNADLLEDMVHDLCAELGESARLGQPHRPTSWSPGTWRSRPGGPLEEILYHIRGSKNAVFRQE